MLQWGHDQLSWKAVVARADILVVILLQRGHDQLIVEGGRWPAHEEAVQDGCFDGATIS